MLKKYRVLKWIAISLVSITVIVVSVGVWFKSLIPSIDQSIKDTKPSHLNYLTEHKIPYRGNVLIVVTSTDKMGSTTKTTGYELTEVSRAYYTFKANGFEVDIASPKGGTPPVVIDKEDMGKYDYAFLNDSNAQEKIKNTIALDKVQPDKYQAVYFAGGKGTMFDFPDNTAIQNIVKNYYQTNKVIGAVCHGPAALVNVTLDNGKKLLSGKKISSFTNKEELLLIKDAKTVFPFLLQDKIQEQGAVFKEGAMYLEQISQDRNIVTGQNPWSTWKVAEQMIHQLGYRPKHRQITSEENSVAILLAYHSKGKSAAKQQIEELLKKDTKAVDRILLLKHSLMAAMQFKIGDFYSVASLASHAKKYQEK